MPVRPELRVPAVRLRAAQAGYLGQCRGRVQHLGAGRHGEHGGDDVACLGQVRRAGHVRDHAARRGGVQRRPQQLPLQRLQAGHVAGAASPAGLRAPAQRAEAGAGHVGEHPAECAGPPGRTGAVGHDNGAGPRGRGRAPDQPRPVLAQLGGGQPGAGADGQAREHARLAARSGAQVEPALAMTCSDGAARRQRGPADRDGRELTGLVLHARPPGRHRGDARRVALGQIAPVRGPAGWFTARRDQLGLVRPAGEYADVHPRALVVGGEHRLGLRERSIRRLTERGGERLDDPPGMAVADREMPGRVTGPVRRCDLQPAAEVVGRHPAEHGVDEPGRARTGGLAHQRDRRGDRSVRRHPGREQLVRAQPQYLTHGRVERRQVAVAAQGEHRVIAAAPAQRAVRQLGRERGVPAGQAALREQLRQQQVGVRVPLGHRQRDVQRHPAGGIAAAARAVPATVAARTARTVSASTGPASRAA